ncbi:Outer membrane protein H precursor [Rubellimicrobium mesophilum DSM 19309]|uniref:Outer membrane protein H n=1 Tax=Rubellimicrobium mesophilum DSM 19309 TaxID=442562 RepID=A0A017HSA0_9RHOB|nr:OmpH family outer membrane protein [Rubellimicrobium mesophilum]EYD77266.1 Outer membrane protein H precursor [Rubellimicrobium mesophilum DSM 19309]
MRLRALVAALLLGLASGPAVAQDDLSMGQVRSPILTIDVDRLVAETRYGQRLGQDLKTQEEALAAENRRIEAELTAEESSLTERRPTMEVAAFRAEAEAFDAKVQRIRAEQDAKEQALSGAVNEGRTEFLNAATPVLAQLMIDRGAAVILQRRDVFLGASLIDITDEAVAAIDAQLGDGRTRGGEAVPDSSGEEAPAPRPGGAAGPGTQDD